MTTDVRISRVEAASCMDHADVVLESAASEYRVRIDAANARAIMAELAGVPSEFAMLTDLLRVVLEALQTPMVKVEVFGTSSEPYGRLLFQGEQGLAGVGRLPAGVALMLAARLELPVVIRAGTPAPAPAAPLPASIQAFLDGLDLGED